MFTSRLKHVALLLLASCLLAAAGWGVSAAQSDRPSGGVGSLLPEQPDLDNLEGVWELISEEHDGQQRPLEFTSYRVTFRGKSVSTEWVRDEVNGGVVTRSTGKSPAGCTCTLDSAKRPREMTITGDNLKIQAIYRLEKDRITKKDRLTIAHFGKPENARPTGFKPVKGDDNILVVRVLEREKKKQPPAPPTAPGGVVGSFFRTSPQDAEKFFPGAN